MKLMYGTANPGKLSAMRENMLETCFTLIEPPYPIDADESGNNPMENAAIKALAHYNAFRQPVFALDSGLYIEGLSDAEQPGTHVRRVGGKRLTDDEMIVHYGGIAARMGGYARARYRNAVCLILDDTHIYTHDGDDIASESFYLCDKPHPKRIQGFPLDSISITIKTKEYYFDVKENYAKIVGQDGYARFFSRSLESFLKDCPGAVLE